MARIRWFSCLLLAVLCPLSYAQQFWESKPYQNWSPAEAEKMLRDSPWARRVTLSSVTLPGATRSGRGITDRGNAPANDGIERSDRPNLTYTVQLRSAMPVRQAVVRQKQLASKYDKMALEQRAAFDAKWNEYLATPQEYIVVYVTYESSVSDYVKLAQQYWNVQTNDLVRDKVSLTLGGERLEPVGYTAVNGIFQFHFPRPAALPDKGSALLQFTHPALGSLPEERVLLEFKLGNMLVDGKPVI